MQAQPSRSLTTLVHALCTLTLATSACGGAAMASRAMGATAVTQALPMPVPLSQSHFAKDPDGTISEDKLQLILDAPQILELPVRVGVLPVVTAKDWRGPGPDYERVPAGTAPFVKALRASDSFSLVSEVMPIPSGALGMEALRMVAARYRLRYVVLYREVIRHRQRLNGWAVLYGTLVGALFVPGETLYVDGYLEASLFDVKTGLLLFTTRRAVSARERSNVWYQSFKIEALENQLAQQFAGDLAKDVKLDVTRFADALRVEAERRAKNAAAAGVADDGAPAAPGEALFNKLEDKPAS